MLRKILAGILALCLGLLLWTYSWTFTDEGRLKYRAALMARLISMQSQREFAMTPQSRQRANDNTLRWLGKRALRPMADIRTLNVPGAAGNIPVRVYIPKTRSETPLPLYIMIHGGGYWMGNDFRIEEPRARQIAGEAQVIVLAPDYRLAPEHPFPAALDDCYSVLKWVAAHGHELGGDVSRIAVGGGSAGGNLSAAVALRARDESGPTLQFLLLTMPSTDLSGTSRSKVPRSRQLVLTAESGKKMRDAYVPDEAMRSHAYVSPLLADNHSALPPTYIVTGQFDPLRDEGEALGEKIQAAGVPVIIHRVPGVLHGFLGTADIAQDTIGKAASVMKAVLHEGVSALALPPWQKSH